MSETLGKQGAELVFAGRSTESDEIRRVKGIDEVRVVDRHFPTMRQAIRAYRRTIGSISEAGGDIGPVLRLEPPRTRRGLACARLAPRGPLALEHAAVYISDNV